MEKLNHKTYRKDLAEKLKDMRSSDEEHPEHSRAKTHGYLERDQETNEYNEAEKQHRLEKKFEKENPKIVTMKRLLEEAGSAAELDLFSEGGVLQVTINPEISKDIDRVLRIVRGKLDYSALSKEIDTDFWTDKYFNEHFEGPDYYRSPSESFDVVILSYIEPEKLNKDENGYVPIKSIYDDLKKVGLRPATILELLSLVAKCSDNIDKEGLDLLALGTSKTKDVYPTKQNCSPGFNYNVGLLSVIRTKFLPKNLKKFRIVCVPIDNIGE